MRELYLKLDTANPTHSFKDRVVAVASAKAQELGLETLACSSTGNLAGAVAARAAVEGLAAAVFCPAGLEREKLARDRGLRRDDLRGPRQLRRLQPADRRALVRAAVGVRQRRPARRTTPRARRRLRTRSPSSSAGRCPTSSSARSRPARCSRRWAAASTTSCELGLVDGPPPRLIGAQARGLRARRGRVRARTGPSRPSGPHRSRARSRSATRPTATTRSRRSRASGGAIHAVPEDEIGANMTLLAETLGRLRRGGGRDLPRRAPRGHPRRDRRRRTTASCCSSPATG